MTSDTTGGEQPAEDVDTTPRVSVIVPCFNYGRMVSRAIQSVQQQTFRDLEIIVLDNASTDDSLEHIQRLAADDQRINVVSRPANIGALPNVIDGHRRARGVYSLDVDADDWAVAPDALERQVAVLDAHPTATFVFNRVAHFDSNGTRLYEAGAFQADCVVAGVDAVQKVLGLQIQHSGTMFRRAAYEACGGYDATYTVQNDLKLYVDLCALGDVAYLDDVLYAWHQHGGNHSQHERAAVMLEELVRLFDHARRGPLGTQLDPRSLDRLLDEAMLAGPTSSVFGGDLRSGWRELSVAARLRPRTLVNRRVPLLAARTVLGQRGFDRLRSTVRGGR